MVEGVRAAFNIPGCEVCDSGRFHRGFIRTVYSIHENIQNFYLQFSISWPRNEEESLEPGGLKKREREIRKCGKDPPLAQQRPMTSIEITQPRYCFLSAIFLLFSPRYNPNIKRLTRRRSTLLMKNDYSLRT